MKQLGQKIAQKRKDLGMTQTEFADELSVTRQTVSRWEAGAVLPDIDKISDIAGILGVSCDYLLKDEIEEEQGTMVNHTGRLIRTAEGRKVRLQFFDEEADYDLFNKDCLVEAFEGNWMRVSADTPKGRITKLIPLSSVRSVEFAEEEK